MRKTTIRITKKFHSSLKKIENAKKLEKFEKSKNVKRSPKILKSNEEEISNDVVILISIKDFICILGSILEFISCRADFYPTS